jgi:hypothetical protein
MLPQSTTFLVCFTQNLQNLALFFEMLVQSTSARARVASDTYEYISVSGESQEEESHPLFLFRNEK